MTKIVEISGIPALRDIASEIKDRAKLLKPAPFYNTSALSEGELNLYLLAQRAKMLSEFYPENQSLRASFESLRDVLYNGLHRGLNLAHLSQRLKTGPASGWLSWADRGTDPGQGLENLFEDAGPDGAAVRGIPQVDCVAKYPLIPQQQWFMMNPNATPAQYTTYSNGVQDLRFACSKENVWRGVLNTNFEKSAHHPLYRFEANPNSATATVAAKAVLHSNSMATLANLSKISTTNIRDWQINGILAQNIAKGAGPLTPQETIEGLKQAQTEGIGSLSVAAVIAIITAITAAVGAATSMIIAIKQKEPTAATVFEQTTQGWGTPQWGPEKTDWQGTGGGSGSQPGGGGIPGGNFFDNLTQAEKIGLGVAAAGAVLLLTKK